MATWELFAAMLLDMASHEQLNLSRIVEAEYDQHLIQRLSLSVAVTMVMVAE
jgi:hypothetical protein